MKSHPVYLEVNFMTKRTGFKTKLGNLHTLKNWINNGGILDYILRKDKCVCFPDDLISEELMFFNNKQKLDWYKSHLKKNLKSSEIKSGLYDLMASRPNDLDVNSVKEDLAKLDQNVWEMMINPGDYGLEYNLLTKQQWHKVLQRNLKKFFEINKFDPKNLNAYYAIHGNTDYPHVHLFFYEKQVTKKQAKLDFESFKNLSNVLAFDISGGEEYKVVYKITKPIWDARKAVLDLIKQKMMFSVGGETKNNHILVNFHKAALSILNEIKHKKNKSFMRLSDLNKQNIEIIKKFIFENFEVFKKQKKVYDEKIQELVDFKEEIEKGPLADKIDKILAKEADDFKKQIGNRIIKALEAASQEQSVTKAINNFQFKNFVKSFFNSLHLSKKNLSWRVELIDRQKMAAINAYEMEEIEKSLKGKLIH